jgi:hypothetical protein
VKALRLAPFLIAPGLAVLLACAVWALPANAAKPKCPVTSAQMSAAFGEPLAGPKPPLNSGEACVFGRTKPGNYHVVQITVYSAATLRGDGSSAAAYLKGNRQPGATNAPGVGAEAFVQGTDIWARSPKGAIIDIGADFVVSKSALIQIARAALKNL